MPRLEFVSQSARDPANWQATGERLVNLYAEPLAEGAQGRFALKAVPGTARTVIASGALVRGLASVPRYDDGLPSDRLLALYDGGLFDILNGDDPVPLGAIPDDPRPTIAGDFGVVTITAGGKYFVYDGTSITEPTAGAFSDFGAVEFLAGYTILTERNGRRFQWSAIGDPTDLPGLNFATAETRDDILIRPLAIDGNLWLFNSTSIEIWGPTGLGNEQAFVRVGPVIERGLAGFGLLAKIPGGAFFVGDDGIAYLNGGTTELQPVSTPAVNEAIAAELPTAAFYYEAAGHKFCVLRFAGRPAWVFDLSTGLWHERAEGVEGAWGAQFAARAFGAWYVAGFGGEIRRLGRIARDADGPLIRRAVSRPMVAEGNRIVARQVTVLGQTGRTDLGRPASVQMRVSRDGGMTWGEFRTASLGALGQYQARAIFRSLGQARTFTAEMRVTDDAEIVLWSSVDVVAA
jgi:hypothetical protein